MNKHPLEIAAELVGSHARMAKMLGVSRSALGQWKQPDRQVPAKYCPLIERLTAGFVSCEDLRPDIDWGYVRCVPRRLSPAQPVEEGV
ncbi:MAG: helix-turn-helix domain-containing protein [Rhodocyclaceae bacterium]